MFQSHLKIFTAFFFCILFSQLALSQTAGPFPNTPLAQPALHADGAGKIVLSVCGSHIINDRREVVILKGLDRPSLEWNPQGQYLSAQDIQLMKEKWNANVVRLSLNQNYWFASGAVTEIGSYKQIINAIIYNAINNNMAVILDLHWTDGNYQSPMANQASLRFWSEVASDYKNFGTVLFELFNEPYGIDQNAWLHGNETYVGYQQLDDAVRKTGANNICIVNGLDWGYDLSFVNTTFNVQGGNIVYGSHPYDQKNNFDQNFQGIIGNYPLIFTEFGVNQGNYFPNGYQSVYQNILDFCHKNDVSYTVWAWWVESDSYNANIFPTIIKDWSGAPLNGGVFVHDDMQQFPGSALN